jgi:hypothetical protein
MTDQEEQFRAHVTEALAHHKSGQLEAAEIAYKSALAMSPDNLSVKLNLGVLTASRGNHALAIGYFDDVISRQPDYEMAYFNRAVSLLALGKKSEAIADFNHVCALDPTHYKAHRALGFLHLAESRRGKAMDHWAMTYDLRRGDMRTGIGDKSLNQASRGKLLHDAAQFRFLAANGREKQRFESLARKYEDAAQHAPDGIFAISDELTDLLGDDYNRAINLRGAPEIPDGAVRQRPDYKEIMRSFNQDQNGIAWFDDLLTPKALAALQRYLLESTIWHDFSHIGGFVASYLEDGLACPLILQIADEMRAVFPETLGTLPLSQAWAFKGIESRATIAAHADDAAVSVNFWVTPDEGNLDPTSGGLVICAATPPDSWEVTDYNADKDQAASFLEQHSDEIKIVPYRQNRAVLFNSRLLHRSDSPKFKNAYEYHRINLTFLFGSHGKNT